MKYYLNSLQWSRFFLLYFPWMVCIQSFLFSYSSSIAKTENSLKPMVGKPTTITGGAATHLISSRRRRILPLSLHTPPHRDQNQPPLTPQHHEDHQNAPKKELFSATTKERGGGGELFPTNILEEEDPEIYSLIHKEWNRQLNGLELIASENFVSSAVLNALGSCLTNKYSEGQPNNRYYGGNQFIDSIEILCQQRALRLFSLSSDAWSVNVQPYSGSPANFAVYTALLKPHDRIMGLDLPSGGHLTHGYQTLKRKVSATSIFFESLPYRVNPTTGLIDYEEMQKLAELFKPKLLIAGASAYPRDWDYERMRKIADSVGAYLMADIAHISGLVATNEAKNPFEYCDVVTTTTHKSLRGPRAGMIFCKKNLTDAINLAVFPALQGGPHNHQIAAIAVALKEASTTEFHHYIQQVKRNAVALATGLQSYGYKIVTNGTENHLVLWDVRSTGLNGAKLEKLFELCDISVNKNSIAGDQSAINPGGIRLGTPAMTTRGMKEEEMKYIATLLHRIVLIGKKINHHLSTSTTTTTTNANGIGNGGNVVKLKDFIEFIHHNEAIKIEIELMKREVMQFAQSYHLPGSSVKDATSPIR